MKPDIKPLSKYQAIWAQAKRNGTVQAFDSLPVHTWQWPTDTFLQRRLAELRTRQIEQADRAGAMKELRSASTNGKNKTNANSLAGLPASSSEAVQT